jgi:hypothetical protein
MNNATHTVKGGGGLVTATTAIRNAVQGSPEQAGTAVGERSVRFAFTSPGTNMPPRWHCVCEELGIGDWYVGSQGPPAS